MTLLTFDGFPAINRALRRYVAHAETTLTSDTRPMTADTFERLEKLVDSPSPVDTTVNIGELLYARRNEIDSEGRGLVYGLMMFAYQNGFHGLREDNRGIRIAQSMARDDGEEAPPGTEWPAANTDPGARQEYIVTAPPAPPPVQQETSPPPASDAPIETPQDATTTDSGNNGPPPPPPSNTEPVQSGE